MKLELSISGVKSDNINLDSLEFKFEISESEHVAIVNVMATLVPTLIQEIKDACVPVQRSERSFDNGFGG